MAAPQPGFKRLFEPGLIGQMEIKNRIVKPPMGTNYATPDGFVTPVMKAYYERTAMGGVGLVIVETACVDASLGKSIAHELQISDDKFIPGLSELARCMRRHGAKTAIQLHHAGREALSRFIGTQPVAPSPIASPWGEKPRELTVAEIKAIIGRFVDAAERAKKSGFDGVEIHGAHGYLVSTFLSPFSNKRQDEYGGSLPNRARFLLEIIRGIKARLGTGYPVWARISGAELGISDGITIEESRQVALMCQEAGADAIHVSAHGFGNQITAVLASNPGALIPMAREIKRAVRIPVIAVASISPEVGERALENKDADFVAMGRTLITDPDLPRKVQAGNMADIRPCINCLECFNSVIFKFEAMPCAVNAAIGQEAPAYEVKRAERSKRVCVVGGGPGGMEAARVAALRGHQVVLCEKGPRLGGQIDIASKPPRKEKLLPFAEYLRHQMEELGVKVELDREVTPKLVAAIKPDVVIVATGAVPLGLDIPGLGQLNVVSAEKVLSEAVAVGERVIVIGGGMVGCETADFLAERGKKVTVIEILKRLASGMMPYKRLEVLNSLRARGVIVLTEVKCEEATAKGLVVCDKEGKRQTLEADAIVLAVGAHPDNRLFQALQGKVPEVYQIGDCVAPRLVLNAVAEGFAVANRL
ncbi:MAG: FAD-dependent oxidoreductase [Chloroflexi bacterium]|nr:FAD-dependent oxidoreductase [Chloroflexota bacterium]